MQYVYLSLMIVNLPDIFLRLTCRQFKHRRVCFIGCDILLGATAINFLPVVGEVFGKRQSEIRRFRLESHLNLHVGNEGEFCQDEIQIFIVPLRML